MWANESGSCKGSESASLDAKALTEYSQGLSLKAVTTVSPEMQSCREEKKTPAFYFQEKLGRPQRRHNEALVEL